MRDDVMDVMQCAYALKWNQDILVHWMNVSRWKISLFEQNPDQIESKFDRLIHPLSWSFATHLPMCQMKIYIGIENVWTELDKFGKRIEPICTYMCVGRFNQCVQCVNSHAKIYDGLPQRKKKRNGVRWVKKDQHKYPHTHTHEHKWRRICQKRNKCWVPISLCFLANDDAFKCSIKQKYISNKL